MECINPKITIQNLEDDVYWLVSMENAFDDGEFINIQLMTPRNQQQGLAALQRRVLVHAREKLQRLIDNLERDTPNAP